MVVAIKSTSYWHVTPCSLVEIRQEKHAITDCVTELGRFIVHEAFSRIRGSSFPERGSEE